MKWKILVSAPYMLPEFERFQAFFKENDIEAVAADVNERLEEADLLPIIAEYDGVVCGDDRFTVPVLDAAKKLKVISKWGTGIDSINKEEANARGIRVCRTIDAFTEPVADSALGYILTFARRLPWMDRQMKGGIWDKIPGRALNEQTIGVVGVGATGSGVIRRAKPFGGIVLGCDIRDVHPGHIKALGVEMVSFDELLERSDYVTLHTDLNETSHHLMSTAAFQAMKNTAVMVNLARGPSSMSRPLCTHCRPAKSPAPRWTCSSMSHCLPTARYVPWTTSCWHRTTATQARKHGRTCTTARSINCWMV